jgi:hypothetical protein
MRQNDPTRLDSRVLDGHTDAGFNESMRVTSTHRINKNSTQTIVVREEEKEPDFVDMILGGLMGEFKEDPDFAMIGVDLGVSLVPILDQASDIRDILAHLYYMIFDGQHSSFMRWVALAFTLIGLFPVVGSIIKSASKFVIKGVKEALEYLGDILSLFKNVLPEGSDISKLDAYISSNWNRFVEYAMSAWKSTITKLSGAAKLIRAVSSSIADTIVAIENYAKTMLPRAFEWIKAKWDEILSKGKQKVPRQAEERAELLERLSRESGKVSPSDLAKAKSEAESLIQAIDEGKLDTKGMKPDRRDPKLSEPDLDFVLRNQKGLAEHYIELKTPIDPKRFKDNALPKQANDIAYKIKRYGQYGKGTNTDVIIDLKNLNPDEKLTFLSELRNNGVDLDKVIIINEK